VSSAAGVDPRHLPAEDTEPEVLALAEPHLGEEEEAAVLAAVRSGFVSSAGPLVRRFEDDFAARVGSRYAVACSSGTAALHVALRLAGVGRGSTVALSDFTFVASANAALYDGAEPVLVDSEPGSWCLDPALVAEHVADCRRRGRPLPTAVEVVHVLGQPADVGPLRTLCDEHGIVLVEDAAESLGAGWTTGDLAGRSVGTVGKLGAFSFNGNKIITTGGGGMIVTDDERLAERARHLTTQARLPDRGYLHDEVGYNYRLTNLAAALGVVQLGRLDDLVARRREVARRYDQAFSTTSLTLPPRVAGTASTFWLYSVLVPRAEDRGTQLRDSLLDHLQRRRITARALWRPLHEQPVLRGAVHVGGAVGADLFRRGVSLPCSASLSCAQQDRVVEAVQEWCATAV